MQGQGEMLRRK